jgi:tripartite-type tricarboxylate transporter receptor subunit TctC
MPDVRERLAAIGMEPSPSTQEQLAAEISSEVAKWAPVVKRARIHVD